MVNIPFRTKTIAGKLWLSFGLLIAMAAVASLIVYWQVNRVETSVTTVLYVQEPLEQALLEMQVAASETVRVVSEYARDREARHIVELDRSKTEFEGSISEFNELGPVLFKIKKLWI